MSNGAHEFDQVDDMFGRMLSEFPQLRKELLTNGANKIKNAVEQNIDTLTNEHKGKLKNSVTIKVKKGYAAVRPKWKQAPHTHLVENGHRNVSRGPNDKKRDLGTFTIGKHIYRTAFLSLQNELTEDAQRIKERMIEISNRG